jgi:para-nitrobenzyl esterase
MTVCVETTSGALRGVQNGDVRVWRGIPYAGPAHGEFRFAPPGPVSPWAGVRDCSEFGAISWQNETTNDVETMPPGLVMSEDCLNLNVWVPEGAEPGSCPVLVWIHGGGFVANSGSGYWTDGSVLARDQSIVVVALNYRLGAFAGLTIEDAGTASGTFVLDAVAALQWVQDNIAPFGGDPSRVTVGGQSAGAMIVANLLTSPLAQGLFRAAIVQSGHGSSNWTLPQARRVLEAFRQALNVDPQRDLLEQLRHATPAEMLRGQAQVHATLGAPPFRPVIDGTVMPAAPLEIALARGQHRVPVLLGTTRDEHNLFTAMGWRRPDGRTLEERLQAKFSDPDPDLIDDLARIYRSLADTDEQAWNIVSTDHDWRSPNRDFALALAQAEAPVYRYEFAYASPTRGGAFRACHSMELPFVFGNLYQPGVEGFTGTDAESPFRIRVVAQCTQAWSSFVRDGKPVSVELPDWPRYTADDEVIMVLGPQPEAISDPNAERLDRWKAMHARPPMNA